ncbi:efflux RND transporter periplasmic adaptor subunit [Aliiglaciecola sp. SL4]|uniref:efflux RND transporter periplasmic adaptor subunit n=1 Tax=Aliiglaciecola sp. SL4 TaxID=3239806 RepID=UPI00355C195D
MNKASFKTLLIPIALILPLIAVVGLMVAAGSGQVTPPPSEAKIHQVEVVQLSPQDSYQLEQLAYGRLESANLSNLGFELAGKVQQILVDEGDQIVAGQLIAKLDTQRLDASMKELDAALQSATADLRLAKQSQQRVVELVNRNLESTQRLNEVDENTQVAKAVVEQTQARINTLQVEIEKSELRASFDGTIVSRPVDPSTVVSAGQPVVVVQQTSAYDARIAMSSDQAFGLSVGQKHQLIANGIKLTGIVKSIAKTRQMDTRTIDVIFSVEANQHRLLPGDLIALVYSKRVEESGVWVPKQALSSGIRGLWTLFTVSDKGQQKVTSRSVEVLFSGKTHSYVRGALKANDWMVINGAHRLVPGQIVNAVVAKKSAEIASDLVSHQGKL